MIGQRGKSKNTLPVLTERKTRDEIIFKLPDKTAEAVVDALDALVFVQYGRIKKTGVK